MTGDWETLMCMGFAGVGFSFGRRWGGVYLGGGEASERILLAHLEMGGRLLLPRVASPVGASSQDELWPPFRPSSPRRACAAIHKK